MRNSTIVLCVGLLCLPLGCGRPKDRAARIAAVPDDPPRDRKIMNASNHPAEKSLKSDAEWKELLTPEQYHVTRRKGTERPFTGEYTDCFKDGVYRCVCCGEPLFESADKFQSGCGWPAFSKPAGEASVEESVDKSHFMDRTEITCSHCGAHLGHVFDDGPGPTHLRYCINSVALKFDERQAEPPSK